ncbi:hypothetical protein [Nocardia implantans]|uniref:Lipoprotein n=1 Tax=Nocardia implantans TaxID=3108168 RepID=A0ABU6AQT9_9NOCA|nr:MULTISPECIES: hypothetical protein [unclassified Nocardia]MBF6190099.1 hypothetical protein [Nocardia beijingensis]MEA3526668.1 hypothetical protein [Nocardia sp. CDC192]MEB3509755.1 hypothetical protein [Nocardia sp. CDC186]
MPYSRWISRSTLLVAGALAAAALTACGSDSGPAPTGSSSSTTVSATAAPGTTSGRVTQASPEISDAAATQLCDMIRPELSNWRIQGGTLGKIGLNALVHEWALRNGGINGAVLADKPIVDRVTVKACPDVRQQAVEALGIPDLASGLAF